MKPKGKKTHESLFVKQRSDRDIRRRTGSMRAQRDHVPTTVPKNRERSNRWSGPISNTLLTGSREYVAEPRSFAPGAAPFEHRTRQRSQAIHSGRREEGDDRVYHKAQISDLAAGLAPAFMTARGEDESVMETARDTARDTARGSETDYMSTAEPDTYRSTSTFSKDDLESHEDAPAWGLPSHLHHVDNDPADLYPGYNDQPRQATGVSNRQRYTIPMKSRDGSGSGGSQSFSVSPMRYDARPDDLGRRLQHTHPDRADRCERSSSGRKLLASEKDIRQDEGDSGRRSFGVGQSRVEDIFSYARHNRVEDLERMLDQGVPVDVRDSHGNTILIVACQNGHKRAVKAALRRGANLNSTNARGNTALHFCYAFGYGGTLGRYLIDKGANQSIRNRTGLVCYDGIGR